MREVILSLWFLIGETHLEGCVQFWGQRKFLSMGETGTHWSKSSKSLQRAQSLSYERQRSGTVQPGGEMAQGKHQCLQKSEQGWWCEDGLFSVVAVKGQWAQTKYTKFQLKIRIHFFFL